MNILLFVVCIYFHIRKKYFCTLLVRLALALHLLLLCIFVILLDMLFFWQVWYLGIMKCALLKLLARCSSAVCNLTCPICDLLDVGYIMQWTSLDRPHLDFSRQIYPLAHLRCKFLQWPPSIIAVTSLFCSQPLELWL